MAYDFKNLCVLIVDDDQTMKLILSNVFKTLKVKSCLVAADGEKALEMFKSYKPDVVVTDLNMQNIDGIELTRAIRDINKKWKMITPVMLLSGYADKEFVQKALDAGVHEFMLKPFSVNDIATRVAYMMTKPRKSINIADYFGPDRRRRISKNYNGPERRKQQ